MSDETRADLIAREIVSREALERIDTTLEVLNEWRKRSNLIGPREWDQIWPRHVWDCLQLRDHIAPDARIVDLGSGAGFPGLILAATASEGGHVTLIESVGKKCAFLHAAIEAAQLRARVHQGRVEAAPEILADTVTARAFAQLPKLLDYAEPWLSRGAKGVFNKGERWLEELTAARETWDFTYDAIPSAAGAGVILKLSEVKRAG